MYAASVEYLNRQWIIPKLNWWTLGANVDLGFAVCNWFVSEFYVYLSLVFSTCYHWWICLLVWLLSSFLLLLFFNVNQFFFLSFLLPFLLSHVAHRVLVLQPGVRPKLLRWENQVQDTGPPETSWPHIISIGESSPRDLHLNAQTQHHPTATKLQCWTPHAKQLVTQENNPSHQQRGRLKSY